MHEGAEDMGIDTEEASAGRFQLLRKNS